MNNNSNNNNNNNNNEINTCNTHIQYHISSQVSTCNIYKLLLYKWKSESQEIQSDSKIQSVIN